MSQITTHILDTSSGTPAAGVEVALLRQQEEDWTVLARAMTNRDGRIADWLGDAVLSRGNYKLLFQTQKYFEATDIETFYPHIEIVFSIAGDGQHYHVPLLLNPFGYTTYRGS